MDQAQLFRLDGKRVLITGASSGFGAHFAQVLAAAGAEVVLGARRVEKLEATAHAVRGAGGTAHAFRLDVSDAGSVADAFAAMPPVDVVVNNAGINVEASTLDLAPDQWNQVIDTNVKGMWLVSREAIRRWIARNQAGNIVNIASILGLRVQSQLAVYAASKAAAVQLTRSLALDYARHDIRVNAICPGYFATDINREWLDTDSGRKMTRRIPFRRTGRLAELDGPLLLLASDASSYMSGSCVVVDGAHSWNSL